MNIDKITAWSRLFETIGKFLLRLVWLAIVVLIFAAIGRYFTQEQAPPIKPPTPIEIAQKIDWSAVDQALVAAIESARIDAEAIGEAKLNAWIDTLMQRVDDDFLEWYFSYWNQQMLGLQSIWYWSIHQLLSDRPSAAERITEEIQSQFSQRVLRPQIAQLELERIAKEVIGHYVNQLQQNIREIPDKFSIPVTEWDRYLSDIAVISSQVEGNRRIDLSLKSVTAVGAGGAVVLVKNVGLLTGKIGGKIGAGFAGKTATALSAKTGGKVAAKAGGKLLGPIIGIGIIVWDAWDHQETKTQNKPLLRQVIKDYLAEVKNSLIHDPSAGIGAALNLIEGNIVSSLSRD